MPFLIQVGPTRFGLTAWTVYEASETPPYGSYLSSESGLYWVRTDIPGQDKPHEGVPIIPTDVWGGLGGIWESEAEAATGVSAPACYDYIRDRLGHLFEKEK